MTVPLRPDDAITTDDDASFVQDKKTLAWRQFEHDIVLTVGDLDPAAEIVHDEKVIGVLSGVPRQLDAVARKSVAGAEIAVVIECKLYKRKLGIGKIDEFVGKLLDVGASHGILYAANGVTDPARRRAENAHPYKITLRDLSDVVVHAEQLIESGQSADEYLADNASNFSELIEDVVLGSCQSDNCWYGEVELNNFAGILAGACGACGTYHVLCGCCGEFTELSWLSPDSCFTCGAQYNILSYQGDFDGIEQHGHGVDCDGADQANLTPSTPSG